jgi:hypothetical protein
MAHRQQPQSHRAEHGPGARRLADERAEGDRGRDGQCRERQR